MKRRTLALSLGCGVGLLAGLGLSYSTLQQQQAATQAEVKAAAAAELFAELVQTTELVDPTGVVTSLPVGQQRFLLNFWATWCPPCLREMPLLDEVADPAQLPVNGLAVDTLEKVTDFLAKYPVAYPIAVAGLNPGLQLVKAFGNTTSSLPFSAVIESDGSVGAQLLGSFTDTDHIRMFYAAKTG